MARFFLTNLSYEATKLKKPELLNRVKHILGKSSFEMSINELDNELVTFLENKLQQGSVSENLMYILNTFVDKASIERSSALHPSNLIEQIMEHKDEIYRNIERKCK